MAQRIKSRRRKAVKKQAVHYFDYSLLFIIIFLGWAIVKAGILKSEDSRVLSMLLLYVIIPCVILNAFQIERTTDTVRMMELSLLSALMMNVLSLVLGKLSAKLFCLNTVETASVMYSNCTNMVVPLVIGIWGEDWVMYVTCYSIVQTILVWTHARILISGKKEISLRARSWRRPSSATASCASCRAAGACRSTRPWATSASAGTSSRCPSWTTATTARCARNAARCPCGRCGAHKVARQPRRLPWLPEGRSLRPSGVRMACSRAGCTSLQMQPVR